jgi:hypothetical protein
MKMMRKAFLGGLIAASLALVVGAAFAVTGTPPGTGPSLIDGSWLNGLAGGQNWLFQNGITAAGTNQATCTALTPGSRLYELDTVAASTGICLPSCLTGAILNVYNNGAQTVTFYPAIANNPITAAQDTILNTTSKTAATHVSTMFYCAKNGVWAAQ